MDLWSFVDRIVERLEAGVDLREDPHVELKSQWPQGSEATQTWTLADLIASLSNDPHLDGFRTVVYGPANPLERPVWLNDESVLRAKLLKHFDGGVIPRTEVVHHVLSDGRIVDLLVVVDRSETPYVTRSKGGADWVVRVRTSTARRNANRAELVALTGARSVPRPVRKLDLRLSKEKSMVKLTVSNVGTVDCSEVTAQIADDAPATWIDGNTRTTTLSDLRVGHQDACRFFDGGWNREPGRFEIVVTAVASDGEPIRETVLFSSEVL